MADTPYSADSDPYVEARLDMVETIRLMAQEYEARPISEGVLDIMARVPRHRFVPDGEMYSAYTITLCPSGTARRSRSLTSWR